MILSSLEKIKTQWYYQCVNPIYLKKGVNTMFEDFLKWFAASPLASALRVAIGYVLAAMVADFVKVNSFDLTNWESWLIGAIAVATPIILRALNPEDTAYGAKG